MAMRNKEVRIYVKEMYNQTTACNACRIRRRKCNGNPCEYCVSKKQECIFTPQRKRGPPMKYKPIASSEASLQDSNESNTFVFQSDTAQLELQVLHTLEAMQYLCYYWKHICLTLPMSRMQKMVEPTTISQQIQSYSALAITARMCGDLNRSKSYISEARVLAANIYDSPEPDAVSALMMMSSYWQLVVNIPLAIHYSNLAWSLSILIPKSSEKLMTCCTIANVSIDETKTNAEKAREIKKISEEYIPTKPLEEHYKAFFNLFADVLSILGFNLLYPDEKIIYQNINMIDDVHVSEEGRLELLQSINGLSFPCESLETTDSYIQFYNVIRPLYLTLTEWKSGHVPEALSHATSCFVSLQLFMNSKHIGILCDLPHICMISALYKFFFEMGFKQYSHSVAQFVISVCNIMSPEFDFVKKVTEEYITFYLDDTNSSTTTSVPKSHSIVELSNDNINLTFVCNNYNFNINNETNTNNDNNCNNNNNANIMDCPLLIDNSVNSEATFEMPQIDFSVIL